MAKRSNVSSYSQLEFPLPSSVSEEVVLINLVAATIQVAGSITGREYIWRGAGSEVKVAREDADILLQKRRGGCCGGAASPWFELKQEV